MDTPPKPSRNDPGTRPSAKSGREEAETPKRSPRKIKSSLDPAAAWPFPTFGAEKPKTKGSLDPAAAWPFPTKRAGAQKVASKRRERTKATDALPTDDSPKRPLPNREQGRENPDAEPSSPLILSDTGSTEQAGFEQPPPADQSESQPESIGVHADQGPTRVERLALADALDRGRITNALVQLISQRIDVAPVAIGLFGHWGSGKSSQIDFVKKELAGLSEPRIRFAEFNAWHHEKNENLGASLAQTVVEALIKDLGFFNQLRLSVRLAIRRKSRLTHSLSKDANGVPAWLYRWTTILTPLVAPALLFAFAAFVALRSIELAELNAIKNWLGTFATAIGTLWLGWHKFVAANLTQWFKRLSTTAQGGAFALPDYSAKLGSFHDIHTTLKHLCALELRGNDTTPASGDYLFLVIDDLDRCAPLAVKEVFDAVRLVASIPRVVTLVAIDDRIAFAAVATHYEQFSFAGREAGQVARDHLAKVFQVAVTLPPVDSTTSSRFIIQKLFAADLGDGSSDFESTSTETEGIGMTSTLKESPPDVREFRNALPVEIALFAELASETSISNPRELWRLKQAWLLLKGMVLRDGDSIEQMEPWMRSLFVREWELQASSGTRARIATLRESLAEGCSSSATDRRILKVLALETESASARRHLVDAVLLPSASCDQTGLLAPAR